jgi:hypothetical protein
METRTVAKANLLSVEFLPVSAIFRKADSKA